MSGRRFPWRRRGWQHAARCGRCGWYPQDPLSGRVHGRHDPKFTGHSPSCAVTLARHVRTAGQLADQFLLLELWWAVSADIADRDKPYLAWSCALTDRADMLSLPLPVPDHVPEGWMVK